MTALKVDEQHTLDLLKQAAHKAADSIAIGCKPEGHAAVVALSTNNAGVIALIYTKVADIYCRLEEIKTGIDQLNPSDKDPEKMSWAMALKRMIYHAPYAVAFMIVGFMFWCNASGLSPIELLPWIKKAQEGAIQ